jgi:diguanylate cyclase (GGDEF)-like protein/PAS domain S-box-containing protein
LNEETPSGPRNAGTRAARTAPLIRRRALWESLGACLGALLIVGAGIFGLWVTSTHSIRDNFHHYLIGLAETASTLVDPGLHRALHGPEQRNDVNYTRAVDPLRRMRRAVADVHYVYTIVREGSSVRFVLDAADPGRRTRNGIDDQAGVGEVYGKRDPAMLLALGADGQPGVAAATDRPYVDQWGTFMTGWAPLRDAAGAQFGAIGVDVDASAYFARLATARYWALLGLVPAGLLIALFAAALYAMRLRALADAEAAHESAEAALEALRELAQERARLAQLIEGTDAGLWEWNVATGEEQVDERWVGMIGYRLGQIDPQRWKELIHPEDLPALDRAVAECVLHPGLVLQHEFRMRHAQGHWVWIMSRGTVLERDAQGRALRMAGIHLDITVRKTADLSLEQNEYQLRMLFELSPVGIVMTELETGRFLAVNDAFAASTGYSRDELLQRTYWDITPISHMVSNQAQQHSLALTQRFGPFEKEYRRKDGSLCPVLLSGFLIRTSAGAHVSWTIVQDLSSRHAADVALRQSELKFRSLFELSPVGISLNDLDTGQFLQVNDALVAPTGYTREELLQLKYWDLTPARFAAQEQEQLESLKTRGSYGPYEKVFHRKDGRSYSVLLSGIRIWDGAGRAVIWSIVQDISERKAMESELAQAATRDKLTGLANRALFMECLGRAVTRVHEGRQPLLAVLFLDCDRFKLVNDTLGHKAGDELLQQIARRLRAVLRSTDLISPEAVGNVVSRFGGDEFLILINDLKAPSDATLIAERLLNALAPVHVISGSEVHSTASVGIVTSDGCLSSAEDIVRNADVAMYEAKRSGRACSVVFNEAMHTRLARHVTIETELRRAIGTSELSLVYQPIVELQSGRMVSAEALLRWNHPRLGSVSPSEFIPIAEESGLIVALGHWVLKEALRAMMAWRRIDPQRAPATISVNISRAELGLGRRLLEQVRTSIDAVGLPAHCLQLEVTEREVMRNPEASLELMHALRRLGIKLAMDDFGTGTSSLAFLRQYPFDVVKIDRSFVRDLTLSADVLAVIHATINLVENLGMVSLAEGVEDPSQVAVLLSLGCRQAQGYLFSRPVGAGALLDALHAPDEAIPEAANGRAARVS